MATSITVKQNDTFPFLLLSLSTHDGLIDWSEKEPDKIEIRGKNKIGGTVTGVAETLSPPVVDDEGVERNVQYKWGATDNSTPESYSYVVKVFWDESSSPPLIETFPNAGSVTITVDESP